MSRVLALLLAAIASPAFAAPPSSPPPNPERRALFGEMHLHSSWSIDAYAFGTHDIGPEDAIRFAKGQSVPHPGGYPVKLERPLDFLVVMEHSEYTGALQLANDPESPFGKTMLAKGLKAGTELNAMVTYKLLAASLVKDVPVEELQGPEVAGYAWKRICEFADAANQPGTFTTFAGWEWTSTPDYKNLHRIVIFKDPARVPEAEFSSLDSTDPVELWKWMDGQRAAGHDVIAVSHNGNLSDGALYPRRKDHAGRPIDQTWADARMRHEPVAEIAQCKGQSETTPLLSPDDEFADFNVFVWLLLGAKGTPTDYGSYMRLALRDGVAMQGAHGFNPYKFGFTGGSDAHSASSSYRAEGYFGQHGAFDDTPEKRLSAQKHLNLDNRQVETAGLTGVWAERNDRDAIWSAWQRKETFATSGPRLEVRLFGGWAFEKTSLDRDDWVANAYAHGVPMGGDLPAPTGRAPTFVVWAAKDPGGANLDRIQIVKGWARNGQSFERIYDVAWSGPRKPDRDTGKVPAVGNTVDISNGTYTDTIGAGELRAVWADPDFDPALDAFYYARVLQIPTPRWTTIEAAKQKVVPPSVVPLTLQDRAWSSPIWYTPDAMARRAAGAGTTVAGLEQQGAVKLGDAQLKSLVVGKTFDVRNTVTGGRLRVLFGEDGRRLVLSVGGQTPELAQIGNLLHSAPHYEIQGGSLVTHVDGVPFEVTVYERGDQYLAARSDELGYANYSFEAVAD